MVRVFMVTGVLQLYKTATLYNFRLATVNARMNSSGDRAHLRNSPISCARGYFGNNRNNLNTTTESGVRANQSAHRFSSFTADNYLVSLYRHPSKIGYWVWASLPHTNDKFFYVVQVV